MRWTPGTLVIGHLLGLEPLIIPAASAAAATLSMFALPRRPIRIVGASLVAVLALVAFFTSWSLRIEVVNSAKYWAENVAEIRSGLPY